MLKKKSKLDIYSLKRRVNKHLDTLKKLGFKKRLDVNEDGMYQATYSFTYKCGNSIDIKIGIFIEDVLGEGYESGYNNTAEQHQLMREYVESEW